LQVGSLLPVKRPLLSIEAVARREEGALLLIGEGPLAAEADALAQRLLPGRYARLARVEHKELPSYYRAADVVLFPSDQGETAGLVPLESLACGTPVVASDDETRRWMLGGAAVLVDPRNSLLFAAAIEMALSTPQPKRLREHALRFSWGEVATKFEALFSS
jgi:glycosyltransferase involved in cell wall biosynthesis